LGQISPPVERAFILEYLRLLRFRQHRHLIARVKRRRQLTLRMRCETQTQTAPRCVQRPFEFDSRKFDFVSPAPRQSRGLIPQNSAPPKGCFQFDAPSFQERTNVFQGPRLLCDDGAKKAQQNPTEQGRDCGKKDSVKFNQNDSRQNKQRCQEKENEQKIRRRSMVDSGWMQAENDTAGKRRGNRYGRQPHGILLNFTSVSM
jgi:hypothetical protein